MLFEKSRKFIRLLPACGGTFSIGAMGPVGRRSLPAELPPDTIYANIGNQAEITDPAWAGSF
ncbi:hypothetical protein J19TS2_62880 [Cohnella xylanilytica]|nr:hypothetical protein J19TS2_62880 [Cohnella xylanilytica]